MKILERKNTIKKFKNLLNRLNNKLDVIDDRISELEDRLIEFVQSEQKDNRRKALGICETITQD